MWWFDAIGAKVTPLDATLCPPDFRGFTPWPEVHELVIARVREANAWHMRRKRERRNWQHGELRATHVVADVEFDVGRAVSPFELNVTAVPVDDDQIRAVNDSTYLVPEQVYASTAWTDWLYSWVRNRR